MMTYLEARNITKQYSGHKALDDVSIQIPRGCVYGMLGPNGAGKTTLIRLINRITAPDSGQIIFDGHLLMPSDVYNIGYLPEERGLYKKMKVGEHAIFLAQIKGLSKKDAKDQINFWFDKFDITSWKDRKIEELSKGMQQKVQFITTVVHNPDLLILDEPFSGFDPVNAEILKGEILELKAKGKTIILSTHNMESVEALCDQITLINKSKVVLQGDVEEIRNKYKTQIFNIVVAGENFDMVSEQFSVQFTENKNNSVMLHIQKHSNITNSELLKEIALQYEIIVFEEKIPSMSEIFIQTVTQR